MVWVGARRRLFGALAVADSVRRGAPELVAGLRSAGVRATMLTGDNEGAARRVAAAVGLGRANVFAGLAPADKLAHLGDLRADLVWGQRRYQPLGPSRATCGPWSPTLSATERARDCTVCHTPPPNFGQVAIAINLELGTQAGGYHY